MWDLGRVGIRSLTLASEEAIFRFEPMTLKSQGNNFTVAPIFMFIIKNVYCFLYNVHFLEQH